MALAADSVTFQFSKISPYYSWMSVFFYSFYSGYNLVSPAPELYIESIPKHFTPSHLIPCSHGNIITSLPVMH